MHGPPVLQDHVPHLFGRLLLGGRCLCTARQEDEEELPW